MGYIPLGPRPVTATADTTEQNVGNWTCLFTPQVLGISQNVFEMYHVFFTAPTLTTGVQTIARVLWNEYSWDITLIGQGNSWDPAQPLLMTPGDSVAILFDIPIATGPPPVATAWFRYSTT